MRLLTIINFRDVFLIASSYMQAHGQLREPLIKVLAFFRSMGLSYASPLHIPTLIYLYDKIGEGSYETPS